MDHCFLIIYAGEDHQIKLRLLKESGIENEIPIEEIPYFKENRAYIHTGLNSFHIFHPMRATEKILDFKSLIKAGVFLTRDGSSAWKLFKEMTPERSVSFYEERCLSEIHNAMEEKLESQIH